MALGCVLVLLQNFEAPVTTDQDFGPTLAKQPTSDLLTRQQRLSRAQNHAYVEKQRTVARQND